MTTDSINIKASTVAISETLKFATLLIKSRPLYDFAYMKPPRGRFVCAVAYPCAGVALTLAERLRSAGMALEAWADRIGRRLGVLDAALERVYGSMV
ncbi:hypothetical protein [Bradyrhizobium sp. dw_78]|uniref:hypothetical protein n=1 Tax=Bradyrhizobium sp. dw_78 TaxID=2719793 RepID=UPI001BD6B296|nr:hypothetical protein [Bradyrhizobium sp. dw_78]